MKKPSQRSSLLDLFNSIHNTSDPIKSIQDSQTQNVPQNSNSIIPRRSRKKFAGHFEKTLMFEENVPGIDKEKEIECQEIRRNFESLEKWTNNLEQNKSTFLFFP